MMLASSTSISVLWMYVTYLTFGYAIPPNIVFIWFDDLGFGEVSYNGGPFSTPVMDNLAQNGIILNQHYSDQICSASRSALLTGRYSWKTGLNSVVPMGSIGQTNEDIILLPQVLKNSKYNYNTYMAGKYHLNYKTMSNLPFNRGFNEALFTLTGPQYYTHKQCRLWNAYDPFFNELNPDIIKERNEVVGDAFCGHDLYDQNYEPQYVNDDQYIEEILVEGVKRFIEKQKHHKYYNHHKNIQKHPFFIYYSLFTPHFNIIDPPDNENVDYSLCQHLDPNREIFCKQIQFAGAMIMEVINSLKDNGFYDNTIIVVTSDNGPESRARVAGGPKSTFGQTLPLRGAKTGPFEGGVRTPSIITGGFIDETILNKWHINSCEYHGLVHISDWLHIFAQITKIKNINSDDDHRDLNIWRDIRKQCKYGFDKYNKKNKNSNKKMGRYEIITTRKCGSDIFYSTYIRYNEWKLVINGSIAVTARCPPTFANDFNIISGYAHPDGTFSKIPIKEKYFEQIEDNQLGKLYNSECYNSLSDEERMDKNNELFQYGEFMLFNIGTDKIEACNVASLYPDKVDELFQRIQQKTLNDYDGGGFTVPVSPSSVLTQVNTYDCEQDTTFLTPWEEEFIPDDEVDFNEIWQALIDNKKACS